MEDETIYCDGCGRIVDEFDDLDFEGLCDECQPDETPFIWLDKQVSIMLN